VQGIYGKSFLKTSAVSEYDELVFYSENFFVEAWVVNKPRYAFGAEVMLVSYGFS
jgi:hypothetical protein